MKAKEKQIDMYNRAIYHDDELFAIIHIRADLVAEVQFSESQEILDASQINYLNIQILKAFEMFNEEMK